MSNFHPKFEKIIMGQDHVKFKNLGMSLLFTRLKTQYQDNPTKTQMSACLHEVDTFIKKYERVVMSELNQL